MNDGKSIIPGIAYYVGNPASAAIAAFDVPPGTLVIDTTNGTTYRKTAALGTNTAGYDTISSPITTISGTTGAVALQSGTTLLTAGSAAAITIAAPGAAGFRITVTTGSDFAHVLTFTGSTLRDGTTGAKITWTAAAFQGSSITLVSASATIWNVVSKNLGTVA